MKLGCRSLAALQDQGLTSAWTEKQKSAGPTVIMGHTLAGPPAESQREYIQSPNEDIGANVGQAVDWEPGTSGH